MDPQQLMGGYTSHSNDDFADLQGLSLSSSPVKPSSSSGRASSVEPSSGQSLPMFVQQDDLDGLEDDDEDEEGRKGKKGLPNPGRRKIEIEYIEDKSKRHITFSKRKAGIMKKAYELSTLTGTQVLLLVVSETGLVYTYTTNKLQPLVTAKEGKALIQACLTAEEGDPPFGEKPDGPPTTPQRTRADHRKVSMQVRMNDHSHSNSSNSSNLHNNNNAASRNSAANLYSAPDQQSVLSPTYPPSTPQHQHIQQQPYTPASQMNQSPQKHAPQMMQPPYIHPPTPSQQLHPSLMPSAAVSYPQTPSNLMPMQTINTPQQQPVPSPSPVESAAARTLKKRKTTENLRTGKDSAAQALRRNEAAQYAQEALDRARQSSTIGNLLRAYQQQEAATRVKPLKVGADGSPLEGLDSTIQLFQMSCEDMAKGPEADQARMRGERWIDHVGVSYLSQAIDAFLNDFQVNKVIRTAKDVKASAKDLAGFSDWLFTHAFITQEIHDSIVKLCSGNSKAPRKKASEPVLSASTSQPSQMPVMPNGLVRPPSNPQLRAERAGKTLIEYCEFARSQYDGLGQEQGVTALNGYFVIDRVRQSYVILRGIPIEGDPHSNNEPGPFKVRMPRNLTSELRPRDQFLLSLNRYVHLSYWIPTACGDVHPTNEEELGEDPLNPQYHHMEADKAQRMNDQMTFNYHAVEYQFSTKALQMLEEGELPEDGFGGVSVSQVMHSQSMPTQQLQQTYNPQQQQQHQQQQQQQQQHLQQSQQQTSGQTARARRQPSRS